MTNPNDGMVEVILARPWIGNEVGAIVRVDPERAAWLDKNGFKSQPKPVEISPTLPSDLVTNELSPPPVSAELPIRGNE